MTNAEEYLFNIPMWTKKKNSLSDLRRFAEMLGNPDISMNVIHVAGTNGKGSVCAYMASILQKAGFHTGAFVSPHLIDIRERFLVDGHMVSPESFSKAFEKVRQVTADMMEKGFCHPSYFEFLFLMGLLIFQEAKVDFLILETGMGGRLDATNIVEKPLACVITSISLDHTQYLGDTVEKIAGEKAGIIKTGVPVIYDDTAAEASRVIEERAVGLHCPAFPVKEEYPGLEVSYPAPYQKINAALACRTLEIILPAITGKSLPVSLLEEGIRAMRWPGRMEEALPDVYLDGAHNPGGVEAFIKGALELKKATGKGCCLFFGVSADKDYLQMARRLNEALSPKRIYVTCADNKRALDLERLEGAFEGTGGTYPTKLRPFSTVEQAVKAALAEKTEDELLFCTGSLYLIGEIKTVLGKEAFT